jgi:hypothetical protein
MHFQSRSFVLNNGFIELEMLILMGESGIV